MTIVVHHLNYSRSMRILWMLEELGLEYTIRPWQRNSGFRAPQEAQGMHPLGRFPVVEVDGHVLAESGAILEYFAEREGRLRPAGGPALLDYRFFMHYAEGSVMPPLLMELLLQRTASAPMPFFLRPPVGALVGRMRKAYSGPAVDLHFGFVDDYLAKRTYFAGDELTMADLQMYYPLELCTTRGGGVRPSIQAWLARMKGREAFKRAAEKGGPAVPGLR